MALDTAALREVRELLKHDDSEARKVFNRPPLVIDTGDLDTDKMSDYQRTEAIIDMLEQAYTERDILRAVRNTWIVNMPMAVRWLRHAYEVLARKEETMTVTRERTLARMTERLRTIYALVDGSSESGRRDGLWKVAVKLEELIGKVNGTLAPKLQLGKTMTPLESALDQMLGNAETGNRIAAHLKN